MPDEWPVARAPKPTNRRTPRPSLGIAALIALAALCAPLRVSAQGADQPQISVAPTIVGKAASQVSLAIQIGPPEVMPKRSFISLRGLPPSVSLTEGHPIAPGSWAIPMAGLPTLKAIIPAGISGRAEIVVSLIRMDGKMLAQARTVLVVEPVATASSQENSPAEPTQSPFALVTPPSSAPAANENRNTSPPAPRPPGLSDKARAERALAFGEKYFASGSILVARQYFQHAAEAGLGEGALRLAATYDPVELERLQVRGIVTDRNLARRWYERARELGAPEAEERLAKLGGN